MDRRHERHVSWLRCPFIPHSPARQYPAQLRRLVPDYSDLRRNSQLEKAVNQAIKSLAFMRCNLDSFSEVTNYLAHATTVRSIFEYAASL